MGPRWLVKVIRVDGTQTTFTVVAYDLREEAGVLELNCGAQSFVFINWADIRQLNIETKRGK